jgi:hypothetical protein
MTGLDVREALHIAILRERDRRGVATDEELARQLGIPAKHLSHWRNGRLTRLDRILVELLLRAQTHPETLVDTP